MGARRWATDRLRQGDLTALAAIARHTPRENDGERMTRLLARGFVARTGDGQIRVTVQGRIALLIRRFSR